MKKYVKPTIDVLELRVTENLASVKFNNVVDGSDTPITKYDMLSGESSY